MTSKDKLKVIAQDPDMQFNFWILETFSCLPNSEQFLGLTEEQKTWLWLGYLERHPDIKKRIEENKRVQDEDFSEEWDEMMGEEETDIDSASEMDQDYDISSNFEEFIKDNDLEVDYKPETKAILARIEKGKAKQAQKNFVEDDLGDIDDWEEVDD